MASAEKASKYLSLVQDEFRKHSDGSVCKAQSPETCPFNKRAESGERLEEDMGSWITAAEDQAYLDAVKRGDIATCAKMVREAAAKAMPDIIRDENGDPLVVYHSTDAEFTQFDRARLGENTDLNAGDEAARRMARLGFWFNEKDLREKLYQNRVIAAYANVENPYKTTFDELWDVLSEISHEEFVDGLKKHGYDGIVLEDTEFGGKSFVMFDPEQIKSADPVTYDDADNVIPLSKRFNFSSADIRDEATGRILDIIKNVDAEDASLEWTSGKNPEIHRYRGKRQPIDRVPKKITKQIIVENCKLIKTVDEKLLPLLAGKVYGMLTGKVEAEDFIDWCMDECGLEEWQAYRIARDQIVKAREWIKIADWKHRGVSYVMWCHSGKDAEPRDYHVAKWNGKSGLRNGRPNGLNGFVFNIDNPPVIDKKTGERGLPSTLIGCKCFLRGIKGV